MPRKAQCCLASQLARLQPRLLRLLRAPELALRCAWALAPGQLHVFCLQQGPWQVPSWVHRGVPEQGP